MVYPKSTSTVNTSTTALQDTEKDSNGVHERTPLSHLAFTFLIVFVPLLAIPLILCAFILQDWPGTWGVDLASYSGSCPGLPGDQNISHSYFYTQVALNHVVLTSSWLSNVSQFASTPFLFLFSFLVASRLFAHDMSSSDTSRKSDTYEISRRLFEGTPMVAWRWLKDFLLRRSYTKESTVRIAALGSILCLVLSLLVVIGDKVLIGFIGSEQYTLYSNCYEGSSEDLPEASFILNESCTRSPDDPGLYNLTQLPPSCAINTTISPYNVIDPPTSYRLLVNGLTNTSSSYNNIDFSAFEASLGQGAMVGREIVTHYDNFTDKWHAFFIDLQALEDTKLEQSRTGLLNDVTSYGQDFIATTTSIVTKCISATRSCNMTLHDNSTQYNCSSMFSSGDLDTIPRTGIEKMNGWNTSFYHIDDKGTPRAISTAARLNPFTYNATGLINSLDMNSLRHFNDSQGTDGSLLDGGNGKIAFAISCSSTVYNVNYSMVHGNISYFHATPASELEAAVIKAPLQIGLGSYTLWLKAAFGLLITNVTIPDAMGLAFSQVGLALAAGAYDAAPAQWVRYREEIELTMIPKGPYIFLIVICFLYALLVFGFAIAAFVLRKNEKVAETQAGLARYEALEVREKQEARKWWERILDLW